MGTSVVLGSKAEAKDEYRHKVVRVILFIWLTLLCFSPTIALCTAGYWPRIESLTATDPVSRLTSLQIPMCFAYVWLAHIIWRP